MSTLQRARAECSMIELAPFSICGRQEMSKKHLFFRWKTRLTTTPPSLSLPVCPPTPHVLHGFFSVSQPHRTHTTRQNTTYHNTPQQHHNNTSRQQRQRDRDRDRDRGEEKRREAREERRFIFSVVVHGRSLFMECFCLVKPVKVRFLCLLNSVKYDSSLISFSCTWQVDSFSISAN